MNTIALVVRIAGNGAWLVLRLTALGLLVIFSQIMIVSYRDILLVRDK